MIFWFMFLVLCKFMIVTFNFLNWLCLFVCYCFVNALQPKTTRNTPVVEQVEFIAGCGGGDHTPTGNHPASQ